MIAGPALLFCPADRPERFSKAAAAADSVILDLEDAVAPAAKADARRALAASSLDPARTIVRVNAPSAGLLGADLEAVRSAGYRRIMVAKAERAADLAPLDGFDLIPICETPLGVREAASIAAVANVVALTWGADDLVAAIGGSSSRFPDGRWRDVARFARSGVLIAAASEGKPAFDTVHLDIADEAGLRAEADDAAASGFAGSMCIHPSQVETIRSAFRPTADQVAWAVGVLAAADTAGLGVFAYEGRMVDEPILRQARSVLAAADGRTVE